MAGTMNFRMTGQMLENLLKVSALKKNCISAILDVRYFPSFCLPLLYLEGPKNFSPPPIALGPPPAKKNATLSLLVKINGLLHAEAAVSKCTEVKASRGDKGRPWTSNPLKIADLKQLLDTR